MWVPSRLVPAAQGRLPSVEGTRVPAGLCKCHFYRLLYSFKITSGGDVTDYSPLYSNQCVQIKVFTIALFNQTYIPWTVVSGFFL